jgi:hypothetical protein
MKTLRNIFLCMAIAALATACATKTKFPVSTVIPVAEITVSKKMDKQNNYKIEVTAKYLASPERLTPPRNAYVVWINTQDGMKNIGQLHNKNGKTTTLKTVTAFDPLEVIITAEDVGSVSYPGGIEITRTGFK